MQTTYTELMAKRKELAFQGKHKESLEVQDQAEALIKAGKVSMEEIEAAAYL
jgi:hypothetical protein